MMSTQQTTAESLAQILPPLPDLPPTVHTKDGQEVSTEGSVWRMRISADLATAVLINWKRLSEVVVQKTSLPVLSARAVHLSMLFVVSRLPKIKIVTAEGILSAIVKFARWLAINQKWLAPNRSFEWSDLTEDMFNAWLQAQYKTASKAYYPSKIRNFYQWGADPDAPYPDFSSRLSQILTNRRFENPPIGEVVASRDKRRGPFNREEIELILDACINGKSSDRRRAITWTFLETGLRPEQVARLCNRDLQIFELHNEEQNIDDLYVPRYAYQLKISIIKQKHSDKQVRFLPLTTGCGQLLQRLRKPESGLNDPLFWWIGPWFRATIYRELINFFDDADLRSPRLPIAEPALEGPFHERMPVNSRRFRYALATDRIAQGDTPENVSYTLCQTDKDSVDIYTETSPLIADDFQQATDHALVPLVHRMQGRLDDPENPSTAPLIPAVVPQSSSSRKLRVIGFIGKCGAEELCPRNPVTGCFGCPSFIARPDAPLRELRDEMIEDIENDLAEGSSPVVVEQLRGTVAEIEQWIEHIDRAKALGLILPGCDQPQKGAAR